MADPYVDRKTARQSYRPRNLMSPGLQRAREPFRIRNAVTGLLLAGFAVGVWAYSIGAVKQDVFDDVDEEARALMAGSGIQKAENGAAESRGVADAAKAQNDTGLNLDHPAAPATSLAAGARPETKSASPRGILPPLLEHRFPTLLDPSSRTLVWGAPPLDNVGKMSDPVPRSKRSV
ncbi:hypothetical protein BN946_scf185015.g127 [Trametes cinnabarina]|uniref:Cytochrome c oxidase assembly factor 3 n=1 Tax=Pycnoporus cinnabarinus TaxID=5643 RepID=A0A060SN29_PYCCI|nr:hypothetical protein BN946_scf185015.g127 [Trametes cinnabarina]